VRERIVSAAWTHARGGRGVPGQPTESFVCASAVGYYGGRGDEVLDESAAPGAGFSPKSRSRGKRKPRRRIAGRSRGSFTHRHRARTRGRALKEMRWRFAWGWVGPSPEAGIGCPGFTADDVAALVEFAVATPTLAGPVNAVAPNPSPIPNSRASWGAHCTVPRSCRPGFALKLLFGEMSQILTESQPVDSARGAARRVQVPLPGTARGPGRSTGEGLVFE